MAYTVCTLSGFYPTAAADAACLILFEHFLGKLHHSGGGIGGIDSKVFGKAHCG
jgi:hypothetical protein